jgi:hypothetical protein
MGPKEKIFADGLMWQDPPEKAPNFIKGKILVNAVKFNEFMRNNANHMSGKGWFTIEMKESRSGSIYFELSTWQPSKTPKSTAETTPGVNFPESEDVEYPREEIDADEIPF